MLSISDTNIQDIASLFLSKGYDVAFLVPTETALEKSIIDAHQSVNSFLTRTGIHDYSSQGQGKKYKQIVKANFITSHEVYEIKVSLYRPETKKGDPRIWFYGLNKFARFGNLLGLVVVKGELFIVNCSKSKDLDAALHHVLPKLIPVTSNNIASELREKLIYISRKGYIPTVTKGDTGVGMTLEAELGIKANSSQSPDYKGIELKAVRVDDRRRQRNRNQLFSKIPNWKLSPIKSAKELIIKRGYTDKKGMNALRHTISGDSKNSLNLYFDIDYANDYLRQMYEGENKTCEHDTTWIINDLKEALRKKHRETFWVKAKHNNNRMNEAFYFVEVEHTQNPNINKLETLIETGIITMDYTMYVKDTGKVRDHGYLFKINPKHKTALFGEPLVYDLTNN